MGRKVENRIIKRRIQNSQYSLNADIVSKEELPNFLPELGVLIMTEEGNLYVGNGQEWVSIA